VSLNYPAKVVLGDISVRDGLQHEEKFIPTRAKLWLAEQLILAGFKRIEVTNLGNPRGMPQFADADELMELLYTSKLVAERIKDVQTTAITIRERAIKRAVTLRQKGFGPKRILLMVSTSESHHRVNSGLSLKEYWKMAEKYVQMVHDNDIKVCGTVSTIWGCPIEGPTDPKLALEFTRRWLEIGADDIEHADHDGSAPPNKVYDYFNMVLDAFPDPNLHIAHFHTTRGWGLANVLAALQTGITHFEGTLGGTGGQPANFVDGVPVTGTGVYYYKDPTITGLVCMEDMVVMLDEMGIDTGLDVDRVLGIGRTMEKILGRQLRSETVHTGRVPKKPTGILD
jgi:hydroxymethylglutaryl-CoA lyase